MNKLFILAFTVISAVFGLKVMRILSEIKTDVKKIRIVKAGE